MLGDRMYFADSAAHPADDAGRSVAADDLRALRLRRSNLLGTAALCPEDTDSLSRRACTGPDLPYRASASRHVEVETVMVVLVRAADLACCSVHHSL